MNESKESYEGVIEGLIDVGTLFNMYAGSFCTERTDASGMRIVHHGVAIVYADSKEEAVGLIYEDGMKRYPPTDGWMTPSISVYPYVLPVALPYDKWVLQFDIPEEPVDKAEELKKNAEQALSSLPHEISRLHDDGNPIHKEDDHK